MIIGYGYLRYLHDGDSKTGDEITDDILLPVVAWQPAQDGH